MTDKIGDVNSVQPPLLFSVSSRKFIVMMICTASAYQIYWFYKNWVALKEIQHSNIRPFWRAVFGVIFYSSLSKRISALALENNFKPEKKEDSMAALFYIMTAIGYFGSRTEGVVGDIAYILYYNVIFSFLDLQKSINFYNSHQDATYKSQTVYSALSILIIIVGGLVQILVLFGIITDLFKYI